MEQKQAEFLKAAEFAISRELSLSCLSNNISSGSSAVTPYVSFEQLAGKRVDFVQAETRLQEFQFEQLLFFAVKIITSLEVDNGNLSIEYQGILAKLLPPTMFQKYIFIQLLRKIRLTSRGQSLSPSPLITSIHAFNFLKTLIISHQGSGKRPVHDELSQDSVTDAFLLMFSYGEKLSKETSNASQSSDKVTSIMSELIRNSLLLHRSSSNDLIERYFQLLIDLPRRTRLEPPSSVDLSQAFEAATGIPIGTYFCLGQALVLKFLETSLVKDLGSTNRDDDYVLNYSRYMNSVEIDKEIKTKFLNAVCLDKNSLKQKFTELDQSYKDKQSELSFEYTLLPILQRPLIKVDENILLPVSFKFLVEKFTTGIFWDAFDHCHDKGSLRRYWGHICQKYIEELIEHELLINSHKKRFLKFFDKLYYKGSAELRATDIVLFNKRSKELFLFEVTFSNLRMETSFKSNNLDSFSDGVDKLVQKASQMHNVIKDFHQGTLVFDGVDSTQVRAIWPIVVTMNPFPLWGFVWKSNDSNFKGLDSRISNCNILNGDNVKPLTIVSVDDLELLSDFHASGYNAFKLLTDWTSDEIWRFEPLKNHIHYLKYRRKRRSKMRADRYEKFFDFCQESLFPSSQQ